jgi:hypothetical protein
MLVKQDIHLIHCYKQIGTLTSTPHARAEYADIGQLLQKLGSRPANMRLVVVLILILHRGPDLATLSLGFSADLVDDASLIGDLGLSWSTVELSGKFSCMSASHSFSTAARYGKASYNLIPKKARVCSRDSSVLFVT